MVKKDTRGKFTLMFLHRLNQHLVPTDIEGEIETLQGLSERSAKDNSRLSELRSELEKVNKKKEEWVAMNVLSSICATPENVWTIEWRSAKVCWVVDSRVWLREGLLGSKGPPGPAIPPYMPGMPPYMLFMPYPP